MPSASARPKAARLRPPVRTMPVQSHPLHSRAVARTARGFPIFAWSSRLSTVIPPGEWRPINAGSGLGEELANPRQCACKSKAQASVRCVEDWNAAAPDRLPPNTRPIITDSQTAQLGDPLDDPHTHTSPLAITGTSKTLTNDRRNPFPVRRPACSLHLCGRARRFPSAAPELGQCTCANPASGWCAISQSHLGSHRHAEGVLPHALQWIRAVALAHAAAWRRRRGVKRFWPGSQSFRSTAGAPHSASCAGIHCQANGVPNPAVAGVTGHAGAGFSSLVQSQV